MAAFVLGTGRGCGGPERHPRWGHLLTHSPNNLNRLDGQGGVSCRASSGEVVFSLPKREGVRAIIPQVAELLRVGMVAVDAQGLRHAGTLVQLCQCGGVVHAVLGYLPVGGPLSAGDAQEPGSGHLDRVLPRQGGRAGNLRAFTRGRIPTKTLRISARRPPGEAARSGVQKEIDLFFQGDRLETHLGDWCIGCSDQRVPVPGMANMTRPSLVFGTMTAESSERKERSSVR